MIHKSYSTVVPGAKTISTTAELQQSITTAGVVQQSYCYTTANYQTTVVLNELDVQNEWEENHDGGYFSSSLQQRMGDFFFRISLTADGPQRTRLPVPRTATSPSCLWSRSPK